MDEALKPRLIGLQSSFTTPYPVQVQGEPSCRANIEKICGYFDEDEGYTNDAHIASLWLEDHDQFDSNAVRVEIDDLTVGYLSRRNAVAFREKLGLLGAPRDAISICGASIGGGFRRKDGGTADFNIHLDFDIDTLALVPVRFNDDAPPPSRIVEGRPSRDLPRP
jgi:hypothetical protein